MSRYRHQVIPLPNQQATFLIDGTERTRWHFGASYPRPFLYPIVGPSGNSLTRMGHPGAANHDHHRSVWFAHEKVLGINFWSDVTTASVRQEQWLCYGDGENEATMAVKLGWFDGHDPAPLLEQELVIAVSEGPQAGETLIELQSTFRPLADSIEFGKTNFGFLAVRVAREISAYFGGGKITDNKGRAGEQAIFGKSATWMDYSGQIVDERSEGITYFDHPTNPSYPSKWHVREDGWMGASVCRDDAIVTMKEKPLVLRYLLHVHEGKLDVETANELAGVFNLRNPFIVSKSAKEHTEYEVSR